MVGVDARTGDPEEIAGASMLTGILDLLFDKKLNLGNNKRCIDEIIKGHHKHGTDKDQ